MLPINYPTSEHIKAMVDSRAPQRRRDKGIMFDQPHEDEPITSRGRAVKLRIVNYSEQDCRATKVLLDGSRAMTRAPDIGAYS